MLKPLRWRLTFLYLLAAIGLVGLVGISTGRPWSICWSEIENDKIVGDRETLRAALDAGRRIRAIPSRL